MPSPLGLDGKCTPPPLQQGRRGERERERHKRRLFPKEDADLHATLLLTLNLLVSLLFLVFPPHPPSLQIQGWALLQSSLVPSPHNFYPHLICYPLHHSPPSFLTLCCLCLLLVCRLEGASRKVCAFSACRTERDNKQSYIKVNEISRFSFAALSRHRQAPSIHRCRLSNSGSACAFPRSIEKEKKG